MSVTSSSENKPTSQSTSSDELAQLRHIVFGKAQSDIENKHTALQSALDQGLSALSSEFNDKLQQFQRQVDRSFSDLEDKLQYVDKQHDDKEAVLHTAVDTLAAEHEMFAASTEQNIQELNNALDKESASLSSASSQQFAEVKAQIVKVSSELHSSKTDRKTLARLLATMASNLEEEQD